MINLETMKVRKVVLSKRQPMKPNKIIERKNFELPKTVMKSNCLKLSI